MDTFFSDLADFLNKYKTTGSIIVIFIGFAVFFKYYFPAVRLVWNVFSLDNRSFSSSIKAFLDCAWPPNPKEFRKQIRIWTELRILDPKPGAGPRWYFDPKHKKYTLFYDREASASEIKVWRKKIESKFLKYKMSDQIPDLEVDNVFSLSKDTIHEKISYYLLQVANMKLSPSQDASFMAKVKIKTGFLFPLNLLTGLLSRFDDEWDPIVNAFGGFLPYCQSPFQLTQLNLWLLWGPSTPVCTCAQWQGPVTLQYGFGDENNSIRIRIADETKKKVLEALREENDRNASGSYPHIPCSVTGRIWPSSTFSKGDLCGAQHEQANPDQESFILEYDSHQVSGQPGGMGYYSAYVWVLFFIGQPGEKAFGEIWDNPGSYLLPFFEHTNITDGDCYTLAKSLLIEKVVSYARTVGLGTEENPLQLYYLCAIDDSGCGEKLELLLNGKKIFELLGEHPAVKDGDLQKVFVMGDPFEGMFSACHLPDLISNYRKALMHAAAPSVN